jgi:hypothetical protein
VGNDSEETWRVFLYWFQAFKRPTLRKVAHGQGGSPPLGLDTYTLVFGGRRCLAILYNWCVLGKPKEPLVEARLAPKVNAASLLHRSLIENIRKEQTPLEVAQALQTALNNGETIDELCKQYGWTEQTIRNKLMLLELPRETQRRVEDGTLTQTKALAMIRSGEIETPTGPRAQRQRTRSKKEVEDRLKKLLETPTDKPTLLEDLIERRVEEEILRWFLCEDGEETPPPAPAPEVHLEAQQTEEATDGQQEITA